VTSYLLTRLAKRRNERGAALVEFALVLPIFVLVLFGLISFGMVLALKQGVTNASADAARSVIGVVDNPGTPLVDERIVKAEDTVDDRLGWLGTNLGHLDKEVGWYNTATGACDLTAAPATSPVICVKLTYPWKDHKLVPLPTFGVDELSSEARVQVAS
jgi:Flp pilus assembly protein TadG